VTWSLLLSVNILKTVIIELLVWWWKWKISYLFGRWDLSFFSQSTVPVGGYITESVTRGQFDATYNPRCSFVPALGSIGTNNLCTQQICDYYALSHLTGDLCTHYVNLRHWINFRIVASLPLLLSTPGADENGPLLFLTVPRKLICFCLCLFVSNITQKVVDEFWWTFLKGWDVRLATNA